MTEVLVAKVRFSLDANPERNYHLPAAGSRSMLFVFEARQIGAVATSGKDFEPGSTHDTVTLTFWDEQARSMVVPHASFDVWYGGIIGRGVVESVGWTNSE